MGISGNLKTMALAELLGWIAEGNKTGTLRLDSGQVEKELHFFEGRVISTSSSDPKEHLGHFLVSHGYINETELAKAVEMQESNKMLLGKILTSIGVIDEDDLQKMLYLKSEETLYDLFTWPEGEFQFLDEDLPDGTLHPIDLSVTRVILRGTQRVDEWNLIREHVPSPAAVPVAVDQLTSEDPAAGAILEAVDDDRSIAEIALHTHSSEFHVCRVLVDQIQAGRLKVVRPRGAAAQPEKVETTNVETLVQEARRRLGKLDYLGSLRHLRAAKSLDPEDRRVSEAIEDAEDQIRGVLEQEGIRLAGVPRISPEVDDVSGLDISPDEGFLLSRVNGEMDIQTILKISPMDPLEAQVAFLRLKTAGYIEINERRKSG